TCTFSLSPSSASPAAAATTGSVTVTASATTCAWTAASNASWITITAGSSGTGNGTVTYSVAANTGAARSGTMTIAGQTFTASQAGVPTPPPTGTILFQEGFEDANVASRGWYDNTSVLLSTAEHVPNSASSIQYTFNQAATQPTNGSALRHKFTPSDS